MRATSDQKPAKLDAIQTAPHLPILLRCASPSGLIKTVAWMKDSANVLPSGGDEIHYCASFLHENCWFG